MKTKPQTVGNITLVYDAPANARNRSMFLLLKKPGEETEIKRSRAVIAPGCWVPPGGATKKSDLSQMHSARREMEEETGWRRPLGAFRRIATLEGHVADQSKSWETATFIWFAHIYEIVIPEALRAHFKIEEDKHLEGRWFPVSQLPFDQMIESDSLWLPRLTEGECLDIRLLFYPEIKDGNLIDHEIRVSDLLTRRRSGRCE
jgi:8-oxo-dGTP pyrophosphatase MutT (NUDIX family)